MAERWRRAPLPKLDPAVDEISLNQFEADYTVSSIPPEYAAGSAESRAATVRMFGVTAAGNSVLVHVHGFRPYFYVRAPPRFGKEHIPAFQQARPLLSGARRRLVPR